MVNSTVRISVHSLIKRKCTEHADLVYTDTVFKTVDMN